MTIEEIRKGAPHLASHYLVFDGVIYYFIRVGSHMHKWVNGLYSENPFSCTAFYKFKPLHGE